MNATNTTLSRRALLAAGGGLVVSWTCPPSARAAGPQPDAPAKLPGSLQTTPMLDAWIRVAPDGRITVFTGKAELGQGLKTALLQIAAEGLHVALGAITLVTADTGLTPDEGITSGSHSMQDSGTAILHAATQARALLQDAAAARLGIAADTLVLADGMARAPDGRAIGYGPLAEGLALHVRAQPASPLDSPAGYRVIGTEMPRVDIPAKLTGGAAYVQDLRLPGMLHARIVRQPSVGAVLLDVDDGPVLAMRGVVGVVRNGSYLAVAAVDEWQAIKAMHALAAAAQWQQTVALPDERTVLDHLRALPARDIAILTPDAAAAPSAQRLHARYTRPYTMHAAIGPSCAVGLLADGVTTVWSHTQGVYPLRASLAGLLAVPPAQVRCIHMEGSGCYGHNGADDVAGDAALLARAFPGRPVRVQWMREEEHANEPYGPAMVAEVEAGLDASGAITDWDYGVWSNTHSCRPNAGGLMLQNAALPAPLPVPPPAPIPMPEGGGERNSNPIYALPAMRVVSHFIPDMPLRVSALRSLGAYLNVFAIESFMDELAAAAGADPVAFRLRHLLDERAAEVIRVAAAGFGWPGAPDRTQGEGHGFAFARYKNLGAYCAVAVSLRVDRSSGHIRLGRIVAAVDSGQPVNPDGIRNQIGGAIVQSASWTLMEAVRFDRTRITSTDWGSYPIMRFPSLPERIEVHVVPRPGQPFLGTGEAGQGPTAAAIANAVRDATGARLRDLPLLPARIKAAMAV